MKRIRILLMFVGIPILMGAGAWLLLSSGKISPILLMYGLVIAIALACPAVVLLAWIPRI